MCRMNIFGNKKFSTEKNKLYFANLDFFSVKYKICYINYLYFLFRIIPVAKNIKQIDCGVKLEEAGSRLAQTYR